MKNKICKCVSLFMVAIFMAMSGCDTIAHFDQAAYTQVTSVESDALSLMDLAIEDYSLHQQEIYDVSNKIQKAYLYDKNRPKNQVTEGMWNLIMDPKGHLYAGFILRWKAEKKLDQTFITEAKEQVEKNFDRIAQFESKKIKS